MKQFLRPQYLALYAALAIIALIISTQNVHCQIVKDYYLIRGDSPEIQITLARAIDRNDSIRFFVAPNSVAQSGIAQNAIFALKDTNSFRGDSTQVKLITTATGIIRIYLTRDLTWLLSESNYAYYIYQNATIRQYGTLRITRSATLEGILNLDTLRNFEISKLNNRVADRADADSLESLRRLDSTRHVADSTLAAHARDSASHAELTAQQALRTGGGGGVTPASQTKFVSPAFSALSDPYYSTIQAATDAASYTFPNRVTIEIGEGVYKNQTIIPKNGLNYIGRGKVVIENNNNGGGGNTITLTGADTVNFSNFNIQRKFYGGYAGGWIFTSQNLNSFITMTDVDFEGSEMTFAANGIYASGKLVMNNCHFKGQDVVEFSNAKVNWTSDEIIFSRMYVRGKSDVNIDIPKIKISGSYFLDVNDTSTVHLKTKYISSVGNRLADTTLSNVFVRNYNKSKLYMSDILECDLTVETHDTASTYSDRNHLQGRAYMTLNDYATLVCNDTWFNHTRPDAGITGSHCIEGGDTTCTFKIYNSHFLFPAGVYGNAISPSGTLVFIGNEVIDEGDQWDNSYSTIMSLGSVTNAEIKHNTFKTLNRISKATSNALANIGASTNGKRVFIITDNILDFAYSMPFLATNSTFRSLSSIMDSIQLTPNYFPGATNDTVMVDTYDGSKTILSSNGLSAIERNPSVSLLGTINSSTLKSGNITATDTTLTIGLSKIPNGVFQQGITFDSLSVICEYTMPLDSTWWWGGEGGGNDNGFGYAHFKIKNFKSPYHYVYDVESYNINLDASDNDKNVVSPDTLYSTLKYKNERVGYGIRSLTIFKDRVRSTNRQLVITLVVDNNAYAQTYMQIIPEICYNIKSIRIVKL